MITDRARLSSSQATGEGLIVTYFCHEWGVMSLRDLKWYKNSLYTIIKILKIKM